MRATSSGDTERPRVLAACRTTGIDPGSAELLSLGDSGTFRLGSKLVAKATRSPAQQATAHRDVAISRWLSSVGRPAVVAANDAIDLGPYSVTFWDYLPDLRSASPAEIGCFLARLHELQPPVAPHLPAVQPFVSIADRIATAPVHDDEKRFLQHRLDELTAQWLTTAFELDLERFSLGPPEMGSDPDGQQVRQLPLDHRRAVPILRRRLRVRRAELAGLSLAARRPRTSYDELARQQGRPKPSHQRRGRPPNRLPTRRPGSSSLELVRQLMHCALLARPARNRQ